MKRLVCFDFDDTLCNTPDPSEGKKIFFEKTGKPWPYQGWWGRADSLDLSVFDIPLNKWVYSKYLDSISNPDNYTILATGRLKKSLGMIENIQKILNFHNLSFDEVHLNWGGDTFKFKTTLFEQLIDKLGVEEFVMYDDRLEHLEKFEEWANSQNTTITIVDVINKTEFKNK